MKRTAHGVRRLACFQRFESRRLLAAVPYVGEVEPGQPVAFLSNGGNGCCVSSVVQEFLRDSGAVVKVTHWNDILNEDGSPTAEGNTPQIIGPQPADADTFLAQIEQAILAIPADSPLILLGHSWGGNSMLKTAKLTDYRDVEFLGLYDPVGDGGWRSNVMQDDTADIIGIPDNVDYFFNRFQQNSVFLSGVPFDSSRTSGIFSPDRAAMSDQMRQDYSRDSSGQLVTECDDPAADGSCNSTPSTVQLKHSLVPTDAFVEAETIAAIRQHVAFPPLVEAGEDVVATAGDCVSIAGTASDANSTDTLTYAWDLVSYQATAGAPTEPAANPLATANKPNPHVTFTTAGVWTFDLIVTDSTGRHASDRVVVTVAPSMTADHPMQDILAVNAQGQWYAAGSDAATAFVRQVGSWAAGISWSDVTIADFNGDGVDDVIARNANTNAWVVGQRLPTGLSFRTVGSWSTAVVWRDITIADFTGDGKVDIAARGVGGAWVVGVSGGTAIATTVFGSWADAMQWTDVMAADINGDGRSDIVGRNPANGGWVVAESQGSAFTNRTLGYWSSAIDWTNVMVDDFNGDGKDDIYARGAGGRWVVAQSTGAGITTRTVGGWAEAITWRDVQTTDLNGDGKADLIARNSANVWIASFYDDQRFRIVTLGAWGSTAPITFLAALDVDGDGKTELVGTAADNSLVRSFISCSEQLVNTTWGGWPAAEDLVFAAPATKS